VLLQSLLAIERSIAVVTVKVQNMNRGIPQVLHQSRVAAKMTVACCTVEGMRGRVSFMLLQSLVAVERSVAENATGAHSVKRVVNTAHVPEP
jgi:hypothetical protein